jgi:hypothetical protein
VPLNKNALKRREPDVLAKIATTTAQWTSAAHLVGDAPPRGYLRHGVREHPLQFQFAWRSDLLLIAVPPD